MLCCAILVEKKSSSTRAPFVRTRDSSTFLFALGREIARYRSRICGCLAFSVDVIV